MDASNDKQWTPDQGSLPMTMEGYRRDNFGIKLILSQNWRACVYTKIWKKSHGDSKSSQDHVIKESIACRSEPADSDAKTGIGFLQIAPADNDEDYDWRQDQACWTLQKGKD